LLDQPRGGFALHEFVHRFANLKVPIDYFFPP
jgi:hypothetical protein